MRGGLQRGLPHPSPPTPPPPPVHPTHPHLKKTRAPAKKKFPTEPLRKLKRSVEWRRIWAWKCTRKARMVCLYGSDTPCGWVGGGR